MPERAATKTPPRMTDRLAIIAAEREAARLRRERDAALMKVGQLTMEIERLKALPPVATDEPEHVAVVVDSNTPAPRRRRTA